MMVSSNLFTIFALSEPGIDFYLYIIFRGLVGRTLVCGTAANMFRNGSAATGLKTALARPEKFKSK